MTVILPPIHLSSGTILSDEVYARIGAAIVDGTLPAGQRLRDVELAAQLGVSRTPVREALQRLERVGLVEVAVGRYTRVSEPTDTLRAETALFTAYFMGNALRMALQRCNAEVLVALTGVVEQVAESARNRNAPQLYERSRVMFEQVTRATENSVLISIVREASLAIQRNLRDWDPITAGPLARADGYVELRRCIAQRDADGAEKALRYLYGID